MKNPRDIVAKALFSADEFLFIDSACKLVDVKMSPKLRGLGLTWAERVHGKQRPRKGEWPSGGQNMGIFLPGRARSRAGRSMSMRM